MNLFRRREELSPFRQIRDAIRSSDPSLVRRVLMKFPAELNNDDPSTGCHFYWACRGGNLQIVRAMVELGADINLANSRDGNAPIAGACSEGRVDVATYLLSLGCELDVSTSLSNPMFACIAGYRSVHDEPRERFLVIANLLIEKGIDLTACYIQQSLVDMDATAFAYEFGQRDIAEAIINKLYGGDERLAVGAWAEAIEVAVGNAFSRQKFHKRRYPPKRGKDAGSLPPRGEYWETH